MKQKSMLFYERVKKSNSTLASTSGFSFTCPKSRTKIIPKTSLLKNMKTLQTMTEESARGGARVGERGKGLRMRVRRRWSQRGKMSKFFCGLRGSLNVRGNKCNFFSLSLPLSLALSHFFLGTLAREFSTRVFSLNSCVSLMFFLDVVLSFELCFELVFVFCCVYYQSILFWCLCRGLPHGPQPGQGESGQRAGQGRAGQARAVAVVGTGNVNESFAYKCLCNLAWDCN